MAQNQEPAGKKESLENIAYEEIKSAIVTGAYPQGAQIVEDMVANQLGMSRSPVRIAIKRLQAEGFLERRENKRIYVAVANMRRTLDALYLREALEGMAARLAAVKRTEEDVRRLQEMLAEMETRVSRGDTYELYLLGIQMHKNIYSFSKNAQLERVGINTLEQESVFSYRSLLQNLERVSASHREHVQIANYVISQQADEAERSARRHVHQLIERLQSVQDTIDSVCTPSSQLGVPVENP